MNRSFLIAAFVATTLFVVSSSDVFARGGDGQGMRDCPRYDTRAYADNLTPEQQKALDATLKDYEARITPLQEKAEAKRMELDALSRSANAKPADISALAQETAAAQAALRKELRAMDDKMQGEYGTTFRHGRGYGMMNGHSRADGYRGMGGNNGGYRGHGHGGHYGHGNNGHNGHGNGCTGGAGCPWL